ncbi:MAG: hypothetical protein KDA87_25295, partial [Planctomycetales bacterium]|nr:hypothetical protein [Planctomycetales bacterium]
VHYASGAMWAAAATLLGLVVRGQIQWNANSLRLLLDAILSAETGFLLTGVAVVFAALFIVLRRMGQPTFADIYGHLSGVAAAIGFLFVTGFGFGRIESATSVCLLYVLYAIGCYVAAHVSGRRWLEGIGATLLTLASAQAIAFPVEPHWGWAAAWSLAAAVASTVLYVIDFGYRTWRKTPFDPAAPTPQAAILNNAAASILSIASLLVVRDAPHYALFLSVALLWLVSAVLQQAKECYWAHQGFLLLAAVAGVHRAIHLQPWYQAVPLGDLHPQATQWYALAIVAIVGLWKVLRSSLDSVAAKQPILIRLSELTRHQAVERLTHGFALICLLWLVLYAVFPGVIQELAPRGASLDTIRISVETASGTVERQVVDPASLQVFRLPHQAAAGRGTWWLLIGCLVLTGIDWMAKRKSQRMIRPAVSALLAIVGLGFILFAANWNAQLATASAVRWSTSVYFLLASAALWIYARIASRKLNVEQNKSTSPDQCRADLWRWFGVFTTVTLLPLASMLVAVVMMCFLIRGSNLGMQLWSTSWLATGLLLGAVLVGVERTVSRFQILRDDHLQKMRMVVAPSVVLLAMPMIAMFVYLLARILGSHPITGPNPGSVFANMGVNRSFTIPMLLLAVGLVGNAICLRSAELGLASSLVFNLCATSAYLMAVGNAGMSTDHWLQLAELNSLVSTIFALAWLLYLWLRYGEPLDTQGLQRWLVPQWIIAVVPFLASLAVIAGIIMIEGRTTTTFVRSAGIAGWANLLSLGVLAWFSRRTLFGSLRWEGLV